VTSKECADLLRIRCANEHWQSGAALLIDEFKNGGGSIDELMLVYRDRYAEPGDRGFRFLEQVILDHR
jgi:hypothetical protein